MWLPLHIHSDFSDGIIKAKKISSYCKKLGYTACTITDHGNISGAIQFYEGCKKNGIKPIIGMESYISMQSPEIKDESNRKLKHCVLLAKNKQGWLDLIKITSLANSPDYFYYKPRLSYDILSSFTQNIIGFSGHIGSSLGDMISLDSTFYDSITQEEARSKIDSEAFDRCAEHVKYLKSIFADFYIELQRFHHNTGMIVATDFLRELGKKTDTKCYAVCDAHYPDKKSVEDYLLFICMQRGITLRQLKAMVAAGENIPLGNCLTHNDFYIPSIEELKSFGHTDEEINLGQEIIDKCEVYDILSPPVTPKFDCPDNLSEPEYLRQLTREGWKRKKLENWGTNYVDRVKEELGVFEEFDLCGYFLIIQDIINYAKRDLNALIGPGRGSVGGSLVAYLLNITEVDPIPNNLLFTRFINKGRLSKEHVSLPDIDTDFPVMIRDHIIEYIKIKYGHDHVCQIATFSKLQGRGAIKEVLRIHEVCDNETINRVTKFIPDKAAIEDEMEEMEIESILEWALKTIPDRLDEFCKMDADGNLSGEYAKYFEQAMRIENLIKSTGKHAAGIIVSTKPLRDVCPLMYDSKGTELIAALDKKDVEKIGLVKIDILGIAALDKLMGVNKLLRYGKIQV